MHESADRRDAEIARLNAELERRIAALEAASNELDALSYAISHDLRASLRAIDGFSRILVEEHAAELSADGQRYLQLVRENAKQLGQLVDGLLTFSRFSRHALQKQPVQPAPLVGQEVETLNHALQGRRVEIVVGNLPPCSADSILLRLVFANLLANAVKFTRQREAALIEVGGRFENGEQVYWVKDSGIGFDVRYARKLFGVFQRLHRSEDYEGTGVGLAVVQRIVHRHGGRVWAEAEAEAGKGATIYSTLGHAPSGTSTA